MSVINIADINLEEGSILLIDKPLRWTSFDVVNKLKYAIKQHFGVKKFKIGHAGTLDPLATGLLIVCVGKCTKQIPQIQSYQKQYEGTFTIGATTASYDLEKQPENFQPYQHLTKTEIEQVRQQFCGKLQQIPPIFSAVKVDGKRAFDLARKGKEINIEAKEITIYDFQIQNIQLPEIQFSIQCSKGTYIRSIARDFGNALGCGAYLSSLRRTHIGQYSLENPFDFSSLIINKEEKTLNNRKKRDFEIDTNIIC